MGAVRGGVRVVGGEFGSRPLEGPPPGVRPTSARVRAVLFNSLADVLPACNFVDLYAGCGAVGIEALSRAASKCLFIERDRVCVEVIRRNLAKLGIAARAKVVRRDAQKSIAEILRWAGTAPVVIFADPPYGDDTWTELVRRLLAAGLAPGSIIVVEHSSRRPPAGLPPPSWQRQIGETCLTRWEIG
ncbi:MAG: RsmD family RNA methyltransferase [Armatimonadetes bacterium]|nr:RsmD family RNA methyltransferase [Armatimonadota bacterium]